MINRLAVALLILTLSSPLHGVCLCQSFPLLESCSGRIEYERTDTLSVNKVLSPFRFHTIVREGCFTIDILSLHNKDTVQRILDGISGFFPGSDGIRFVDANFDGYLDIMIYYSRGNTTNEAFEFWLFNPKSQRFEFSQEFTDAFGCNASIDEKNHEITTGGMVGCLGACYDFEIYRLIEGKITLAERESQALVGSPSDTSQATFVRTLERLQSGKMKIVKSARGTLEQIAKLWRE